MIQILNEAVNFWNRRGYLIFLNSTFYNILRDMSENEDITTTTTTSAWEKEQEYEEEFEIEITTQKGSSIKIEMSSYNKLDALIEKAFTAYKRLSREDSEDVEQKLQYQ